MVERIARAVPILVVDDSPAIRSRMEVYLREMGFLDVRASGTIEEALATFLDRPAALVFLDMVMGEERGLDFASRALAVHPLTSVVIMSALPPGHELVTASIAEGARDYLAKPVTRAALETVLTRVAADLVHEHLEDSSYA